MDHVCISGIEPSSVILSQRKKLKKLKNNAKKYRVVELNWLFNVTINDISVIYVTAIPKEA